MIYPIDQMIADLLESFVDSETGEIKKEWIDPETGEILELNETVMNEQIDKLNMSFDAKIEQLRNEYKNKVAEAEAIKAEKMSLAKRQSSCEASAERLKRFLAFLTQGQKYQNGAVNISYRKSSSVVVDDGFIEWASENARELLKFSEPEPRKTDIANAIKAGAVFEHAHIEQKNNIVIR